MLDDLFCSFIIFLVGIFLCGGSIISCTREQRYRENIEKEAVQKGFAEYIRQDDELEFKWKETPNN